jgi:hypothetical protein
MTRQWVVRHDNRRDMKAWLCSLCFLSLPAVAFAQMEHVHPPAADEDCTKLSSGLQAVVSAMEAPGISVEARVKPDSMPPVEPGIKGVRLRLQPMSLVQPVAGRVKAGENLDAVFGGFLSLKTSAEGTYRISSDSTVWLDVLDGDQPIPRSTNLPRLHCGKIEKSLGFYLKAGVVYSLEFSGSKKSEVSLIISADSGG